MTKKEHQVDCVRCGLPDVDYDEELMNPFCGPCKQDVLLSDLKEEVAEERYSRPIEFDDAGYGEAVEYED